MNTRGAALLWVLLGTAPSVHSVDDEGVLDEGEGADANSAFFEFMADTGAMLVRTGGFVQVIGPRGA